MPTRGWDTGKDTLFGPQTNTLSLRPYPFAPHSITLVLLLHKMSSPWCMMGLLASCPSGLVIVPYLDNHFLRRIICPWVPLNLQWYRLYPSASLLFRWTFWNTRLTHTNPSSPSPKQGPGCTASLKGNYNLCLGLVFTLLFLDYLEELGYWTLALATVQKGWPPARFSQIGPHKCFFCWWLPGISGQGF